MTTPLILIVAGFFIALLVHFGLGVLCIAGGLIWLLWDRAGR